MPTEKQAPGSILAAGLREVEAITAVPDDAAGAVVAVVRADATATAGVAVQLGEHVAVGAEIDVELEGRPSITGGRAGVTVTWGGGRRRRAKG